MTAILIPVMVQFGKIGSNLIIKMPTVQIQLILENYPVIIVPCMVRRGRISGAFDNENAEKTPSVF
jgi:hypothetical protein